MPDTCIARILIYFPYDRRKPRERDFSPLAAAAVIYNTTGATLGETRLHIFKHGYLTTYRRTPTPPRNRPLPLRANSRDVLPV